MASPSRASPGQTLLIDADDTLWENNVFFESVIDAFAELMSAHGHDPDAARRTLHDIERIRTTTHGYGIDNFRASLELAIERLVGRTASAPAAATVRELCVSLARRRPVVLDDVEATLRDLAGRHRLILLTKGDPDDQLRKLQHSRLRGHFHQVDVVHEKDAAAYRHVLARHRIDPAAGWMIGNSPRSDIVPALEVGLGAVYIPHAVTWALEQCRVPDDAARLHVLRRFADLTDLF